MTEPTTRAGRALLEASGERPNEYGYGIRVAILAIEAEAVAPWRAALSRLCSYIEDAEARQQILPTVDITEARLAARALLDGK